MTTVIQNEQALKELAKYLRAQSPLVANYTRSNSVIDFCKNKFYIAETEGFLSGAAPARPMRLMPHQIAILNFMFDPPPEHTPKIGYFQTLVYSTTKKSGKTAMSALVGRWVAETWSKFGQIYCIASDYEQARGRAYQQIIESISLDPRWHPGKREIPGEWRIIDREATHIPSGSKIKAIAGDYKGEAGANPTLTLWDELWSYSSESSRRLWDEMTPVPTRARSIRFISTYAGYTDESDLLWEIYEQGKLSANSKQIDIPGWPFEDPSPIFINKDAGICMYWDEGPIARRMPWQTPEYYALQAQSLRPMAFDRLHNNYWTSSTEALLPLEWWDACQTVLPPLDNKIPCVIGCDASVTGDCTAIVLISRHPTLTRGVVVRAGRVWHPSVDNPMNYSAPGGLEDTIREWCKRFNVLQVAYDSYQLHKLMTDLRLDGVAWCKPFSQSGDRLRADKQLYDLIRDRALLHYGDPDMREHLKNAGAKSSREEDTKFRIVKRATKSKIDYVIAMSMATSECLRLNI